jgi:hypothetical protein
LLEFSALRVDNIRTGLALDTEDLEFELKLGLINMVQATQFGGKVHEDASTHLQNFLEIRSTIAIDEVNKTLYYFVSFHSH